MEFHDFYSPPNIVSVIKSWTMREAWTVVRMREEKYMQYFGKKKKPGMI
jgi:hypothetical protein